MNILQSWKDSLSLLLPRNLKLFALVTLKSIFDTYKTLFKYWWFLYLVATGFVALLTFGMSGLIGFQSFTTVADIMRVLSWFGQWSLIAIALIILAVPFCMVHLILFFITCLTARSSIAQKNYTYYVSYFKKYWYCLLLIMVLLSIKFFLIYSWLVIFLLFIFDAPRSLDNTLRSFTNSIRFIIYNLPLLIVFVELLSMIVALVAAGVLLLLPTKIIFDFIAALFFIGYVLQMLINPIFIVILTNIYIKRVHDQSELYFPTPK